MGTGQAGWGNVGRRHSNLTRSFTVRPLDKKQVACGHIDHDVVIVFVVDDDGDKDYYSFIYC